MAALASGDVYDVLSTVNIAGATTPEDKNYYYVANMGYKYLSSLGFSDEMIANQLNADASANAGILEADTTLLEKAVALFPKISSTLDFTADEIKANVIEYIYKTIDCEECPSGSNINTDSPVRC